jgi:transcriptional regulator with XRE-family HTH domain
VAPLIYGGPMARLKATDLSIGDRIRARRNLLKLSVRKAAGMAGISHSEWSRIENGERSADNRYIVQAIAEALSCSTNELTGMPMTPVDDNTIAAQAAVVDIRRALVATDLTEEPSVTTPRPIEVLASETDLVGSLRARCEYAGAVPRIPPLLTDLHAAAQGPDRAQALELATMAHYQTAFVVRYIGFPGESWLAAERSRQAAEALGDPVMLGMAAFARSHAASWCGEWERSLKLANRAVLDLEQHMDHANAAEVLGQLHLTCAFALYGLGRVGEAADRIAEASTIADRTGDTTTLGLMFGPTNVRFWQVSMETDGGDPGKAVEIAQGTNPSLVESTSRQVAFYLDTARALALSGRNDTAALRMLTRAERMAPQRIRISPIARECARTLLARARRNAVGSELRGLAERIGVAE